MKKRIVTNNLGLFASSVWKRRLVMSLVMFAAALSLNDASAQQSNALVQEQNGVRTASPSSILNTTAPNGRIGGFRYNGSFSPMQAQTSRFPGNSVVYGDAGNIVGIDSGRSSRFGGAAAPFKTKNTFELLSLRNEYYRERARANASYLASQPESQNEPRLVTATPSKPFPYPSERRARYGKTQEELLAERSEFKGKIDAATVPQTESVPIPQEMDLAQRLWMRGPAPAASARAQDAWGGREEGTLVDPNLVDFPQNYGDPRLGLGVAPEMGLGGAVGQQEQGGAWSFQRLHTPEEMNQIFIENLETQLLRSPDVNPLSPIQIDVQNGVATVRGVVPTPNARIAAGKILLADPRIQRVNNLLTFVRNEEPLTHRVLPTPMQTNQNPQPAPTTPATKAQ